MALCFLRTLPLSPLHQPSLTSNHINAVRGGFARLGTRRWLFVRGAMTKEELLVEFEDLIRSMPDRSTLSHQEDAQLDWLARASALVHQTGGIIPLESIEFDSLVSALYSYNGVATGTAIAKLIIMIKRIRYSLLLQTRGVQVAVHSQGDVFDYFDSVR